MTPGGAPRLRGRIRRSLTAVTHRPLALLFAAALLAGGCTPGLRAARPGEAVGPEEVLLVGQVTFVPPAWMKADRFGTIRVGLTTRPDAPVAPDRLMDEDLTFVVPTGAPFVVVAPRRTLFLRSITVAFARQGTRRYEQISAWYTKCLDDRELRVDPGDEVVDLGHLTCTYADPDRIAVRPDWDAIHPSVAERLGARKVVHRPLPRAPHRGPRAGAEPGAGRQGEAHSP